MVKINRIYTRTGDDGSTGLVDGSRTRKDSLRVESYGAVDELNSFIGLAISFCEKAHRSIMEKLVVIQSELFDIGSLLASPANFDRSKLPMIEDTQTKRLENWIDEMIEGLPELRSFLLPGGSKLNGYLHVCRAVSRRAERRVVTLAAKEPVDKVLIVYLNRLSDLFFAMARRESNISKIEEVLWKPNFKTS